MLKMFRQWRAERAFKAAQAARARFETYSAGEVWSFGIAYPLLLVAQRLEARAHALWMEV